MNFFTFTKLGRTLLMLTAVIAVGLAGCGGDDNPNDNGGNNNGGNNTGGNNNNSGGGGGGLVLGTDEAWVSNNSHDGDIGLVFLQNGVFAGIGRIEGGVFWAAEVSGTYSVNGSNLTIVNGGPMTGTFAYNVTGNTLKLSMNGKEETYTKTSGVKCVPINPNTVVKGTFTDSRDSKTYKTVKIDSQTWMAENLNYQTASGSWCDQNYNSNCDSQGRLYNWNTARAVCPNEWHLPSEQEWRTLLTVVGGVNKVNGEIKGDMLTAWDINHQYDKDAYGFSGRRVAYYEGGSFFSSVDDSYWWTATEDTKVSYKAVRFSIGRFGSADFWGEPKDYGYSVRCVK